MKMFKSYVVVKPVRANDEASGWLTQSETALSGFLDDLRRYGLRVACYNLHWLLRR